MRDWFKGCCFGICAAVYLFGGSTDFETVLKGKKFFNFSGKQS